MLLLPPLLVLAVLPLVIRSARKRQQELQQMALDLGFEYQAVGTAGPESPFPQAIFEAGREHRAQSRGAVEAAAALYVLARNSEPRWYQLRLRYDASSREQEAGCASIPASTRARGSR